VNKGTAMAEISKPSHKRKKIDPAIARVPPWPTAVEGEILTPAQGERLDALNAAAESIRNGLERMRDGLKTHIEGVLQTAAELSKARTLFKADKSFGDWCRDNGFGEDRLNKNDRAALIDFGKDIDRARQVLERTERKSIQLIHANEWRSPSVRRPDRPHLPNNRKTESQAKPPSATPRRSAESADPINAVMHALTEKCRDCKTWPLSKMASRVQYAEPAVREALKRLKAEWIRNADGDLEYRLRDRDESAERVEGATHWAELLAENAALKSQVAERDATIAALKSQVADLQEQLTRKDAEIAFLTELVNAPSSPALVATQ
jgi:uncharacterized coiled-coil protein SlyX